MSTHHGNPFDAYARPPVPALCSDETGWEVRFLSSPLLQRLPPRVWHRLLRSMTVELLEAGAMHIRAGARADACYVVRSGRLRVHLGTRTLAVLEPGTMFGEDALITGGRRNASVSALEASRVGRLAAERFESWLLGAVLAPLTALGARCPLALDAAAGNTADAIHVPLGRLRDPMPGLARDRAYGVIGASLRERYLAAFVLGQLGYDVLPLA